MGTRITKEENVEIFGQRCEIMCDRCRFPYSGGDCLLDCQSSLRTVKASGTFSLPSLIASGSLGANWLIMVSHYMPVWECRLATS